MVSRATLGEETPSLPLTASHQLLINNTESNNGPACSLHSFMLLFMPCPWRQTTTTRAVEMPENDALAELKFKRSLGKTSPPLTFSYSLPLGTSEQNTKMRRRRGRRAEFNLSLFMGIKLFFPPA